MLIAVADSHTVIRYLYASPRLSLTAKAFIEEAATSGSRARHARSYHRCHGAISAGPSDQQGWQDPVVGLGYDLVTRDYDAWSYSSVRQIAPADPRRACGDQLAAPHIERPATALQCVNGG